MKEIEDNLDKLFDKQAVDFGKLAMVRFSFLHVHGFACNMGSVLFVCVDGGDGVDGDAQAEPAHLRTELHPYQKQGLFT